MSVSSLNVFGKFVFMEILNGAIIFALGESEGRDINFKTCIMKLTYLITLSLKNDPINISPKL